MLEEYARPELGVYDEGSGHLKLKLRKVLIDNNSKLENLEKALDLFWGVKLEAAEHNIEREKVIENVANLLRTWEYDMTGPQEYNIVTKCNKFIAEKDIERHHLPDNFIAGPNFDLSEWLYPIKAGEECWIIENYGHPWYYCPESQVKEGCTERFEAYPANSGGFHNVWALECESPFDSIFYS